jgi:hypothetical protein
MGVVCVVALAPLCQAFIVNTRFVDPDNGNAPYPDLVDVIPGREYRVRVQFGVFQDGDHEVPGGVLGWNIGSLVSAQGTMRRTPGRLGIFTFAPAPPANGLPAEDPFFALDQIDATLGLQSLPWLPGQEQPAPVIRGYESWVSVYEFTIPIAAHQTAGFDVRIRGNVPLAYGWFPIATPIPPDGDEPGLVTYAPMVLVTPRIERVVEFRVVPGPGGAACLIAGMLMLPRRRSAPHVSERVSPMPPNARRHHGNGVSQCS